MQHFGAPSAASNTLQTLARAGKLNEPRLERLQSVLVLGDDVLRRPGDEVVVAELRLDLGDFELRLCDLPIEARLLGREVDDARERQRDRLAAHNQKQRPGRRGLEGFNRAHPGKTPDAVAPSACTP